MKVKCPGCAQIIEIPYFQKPSITNLPACSVVIFEHPAPSTCICGESFMPTVLAIGSLKIAPRAIQKAAPPGPRIILPGRH